MPSLRGESPTTMVSATTSSFYRSQETINEPAIHLPPVSEPGEDEDTYTPVATHFDLARSVHLSSTGANSSASSFIAVVPQRGSVFHISDDRVSFHTDPNAGHERPHTDRASPLSSVLGIFPNRTSQPYIANLFTGPLGELKDDPRIYPGTPAQHYNTESEQSPRKPQDDAYSPRQKQFKGAGKAKQFWASKNRNYLIAGVGEVFGTAMFLFFGFASILVANASTQDDKLNDSASPQIMRFLFISLGFGMAFAVNIWIFARISGAMLNPAITLAMALVEEISLLRAAVCFIAQITGGILGSALVMLLFPGPLRLVQTRLSHGTTLAQGVFLEALMTAELVTVVLMLTRERCQRNVVAAIAIGSSVFIAHLIGMPYTGVGMNPVRSFAPDVVTASFGRDHWVYWVGPMIGSLLAVGLYKMSNLLKGEDGHISRPRLDLMV